MGGNVPVLDLLLTLNQRRRPCEPECDGRLIPGLSPASASDVQETLAGLGPRPIRDWVMFFFYRATMSRDDRPGAALWSVSGRIVAVYLLSQAAALVYQPTMNPSQYAVDAEISERVGLNRPIPPGSKSPVVHPALARCN